MRVEESLGDGFVRLRISEAERRQAKHDIRCVEDATIELLRNSRDAGATRIYVASSREGDRRTLTIVDNGSGIPDHMQTRIFDARVTSKLDTMLMDRWGVHGRGMALFSIRENALSARVIRSGIGMGCVIQIVFDIQKTRERADQSTWPDVTGLDSKRPIVRGPRNIVRACVEFALESRSQCNVYAGLPSEIMATMRRHALYQSDYRTVTQYDASDDSTVLVDRPGQARDAHELAQIAADMGMEMSERNAHRILRGEIVPCRNVLDVVGATGRGDARQSSRSVDRQRVLPLSESERAEIGDAARDAFARIAEHYYVLPVDTPSVRCSEGRIIVSIPYAEDD
jgi:hypothetical protein